MGDVYIYIADADDLSWQGYISSFGDNTVIHVLNMSFYYILGYLGNSIFGFFVLGLYKIILFPIV